MIFLIRSLPWITFLMRSVVPLRSIMTRSPFSRFRNKNNSMQEAVRETLSMGTAMWVPRVHHRMHQATQEEDGYPDKRHEGFLRIALPKKSSQNRQQYAHDESR